MTRTQKRGEWIACARLNQPLLDVLGNAVLLYTSTRDNAAVERAVHDLISIAKQIGFKHQRIGERLNVLVTMSDGENSQMGIGLGFRAKHASPGDVRALTS